MVQNRCLIIQAHPDDEVVCFSPFFGNCDIACITYHPERSKVLEQLSVEYNFTLYNLDYEPFVLMDKQHLILEALESIVPSYDTLITHHFNDLHQDHNAVYECVKKLFRFCYNKNLYLLPSIQHNWFETRFNAVLPIKLYNDIFDIFKQYKLQKTYETMFTNISNFYSTLANNLNSKYWPTYIEFKRF